MRRDGLEPVRPHCPKIYWPYSHGSTHLFDALPKMSQLKTSVCSQDQNLKIWIYFQFSNPEVSIIVLITIFFKWLLRHLWDCRVFALSLWLQGWMGDCSRVLMTTPVGPINSPRLLEHQVMANQALNLQPGLTALTLPQLQLRTSRAHSWVS